MGKKLFSDFSEADQGCISSLLDLKSDNMGIDFDGSVGNIYGGEFGMCTSCKHFHCVRSEFKIKLAKCQIMPLPLSSNEPVTECTDHVPRGAMSLYDMKEIAWYIDNKPDDIGFS